MAEFAESIKTILHHEGGWVCDPNDPGGETNYGVSTLIIQREKLTPRDLGIDRDVFARGCLKEMTEEGARKVYRDFFWLRYGYGDIENQDVATKVFDAAVNMGPTWGHRLAQYALIECGYPVNPDGVMGPKTISALNSVDPQQWLKSMVAQMEQRYRLIVAGRPQSAKFLSTWLRRAAWTHP